MRRTQCSAKLDVPFDVQLQENFRGHAESCKHARRERGWDLRPHVHGGLFQTATIFPQLCGSGLAPSGRGYYFGVVGLLIASQTRRATLSGNSGLSTVYEINDALKDRIIANVEIQKLLQSGIKYSLLSHDRGELSTKAAISYCHN